MTCQNTLQQLQRVAELQLRSSSGSPLEAARYTASMHVRRRLLHLSLASVARQYPPDLAILVLVQRVGCSASASSALYLGS